MALLKNIYTALLKKRLYQKCFIMSFVKVPYFWCRAPLKESYIRKWNLVILTNCCRKLCLENWLAFFDNMKDKKRIKILCNVMERIYSKSPDMQTLIIESMIDMCKEKGVPPEQAYFCFLFTICFIVMGYLNINFLWWSRKK